LVEAADRVGGREEATGGIDGEGRGTPAVLGVEADGESGDADGHFDEGGVEGVAGGGERRGGDAEGGVDEAIVRRDDGGVGGFERAGEGAFGEDLVGAVAEAARGPAARKAVRVDNAEVCGVA
jgi:hypothetical protein